MTDFPVEIALGETIVRGICHPHHLRNGKPYWNAFWPPPERDDVSVIRHDYVGPHFCKQKAKSLAGEGKVYKGLAFFRKAAVTVAGADVVDSREIYPGHADIKHKHKAPPKGQPREGADLLAVVDVCKAIVKRAVYIEDSDPDHEQWLAAPVEPPAV